MIQSKTLVYLNIIFHHTQQVVCLFLLLSDTKACDLKQHREHIIGNGSLEKNLSSDMISCVKSLNEAVAQFGK